MLKHKKIAHPYQYLYLYLLAAGKDIDSLFAEWGLPALAPETAAYYKLTYKNYFEKWELDYLTGKLDKAAYLINVKNNPTSILTDFVYYFEKNFDSLSEEAINAFEILFIKKLRIPLEALLICEEDLAIVSVLLAEIVIGYSPDDIEYYMNYIFAYNDVDLSKRISYVESIKEESEALIKSEALDLDLDKLKYLLNLSCDLSQEEMLDIIMKDSFFKYKEALKKTDNLDQVKSFTDIFFKSQDRLSKTKIKGKDELPWKITIDFNNNVKSEIPDMGALN